MNYKNPLLQQLIESGIPVLSAHFHNAVNNGDNTPENSFALDSNNKSRRVEMWATKADLLVCKHKEKLFFTPMANVKFGFFKNEEGKAQTTEKTADEEFEKLAKALKTAPLKNKTERAKVYAVDPPLNDQELKEHYETIHAPIVTPKKRGRPFKNPQQNS
jgi:hypothetical protein